VGIKENQTIGVVGGLANGGMVRSLCYLLAKFRNVRVCVAAPEAADELLAATLQFVTRVGYRGLGSLEFKRDRRSGRFLIIEPTVGRTDWQEEIATLCGVNLPLMTYFSELGQHSPRVAATYPPIAWRSSVGFRAPLAPGTRMVDGFLRWSDPMPALYYYGYERALLRLCRKASQLSLLPRTFP